MNLREQKKAETSARLLAEARKSFFQLGYAQTSMDKLCADAGVTRGALYHNFGGKEGLFEAVVRQLDAEIGEKLYAVAGDAVSSDAFVATCIAYLEVATDPEIRQIMLKDGPSVMGQRLRDLDQETSLEPTREAIEELQSRGEFIEGNPTALAVLINGALIDAALWVAAAESDGDQRLEEATLSARSMLNRMLNS